MGVLSAIKRTFQKWGGKRKRNKKKNLTGNNSSRENSLSSPDSSRFRSPSSTNNKKKWQKRSGKKFHSSSFQSPSNRAEEASDDSDHTPYSHAVPAKASDFEYPRRHLHPSIASSELTWQNHSGMRVAGKGLHNLGNTCFLNSVLQCLIHTPPLANHLLAQSHSSQCTLKTFCLFCTMERQAAVSLKKDGKHVVSPKTVCHNLRSISKQFRLGRQEDSHEFIRFVLDKLHRDSVLSFRKRHTIKKKLSERVQETSFIYRLFGGYFRSQVKCGKCKYESNKYDPFLDLSLEVMKAKSVTQALRDFTAAERLDRDNMYLCSRCKKKVCAVKQLTVFAPPLALCIHLKRFSHHMMYSGGGGSKIDKFIEFGAHLDLAPYLSTKRRMTYSLSAVLVHAGNTANSGHYYCFVEGVGTKKWYCMNDSSVEPIGLNRVLRQKCYMLFYMRDQSCVEPPSPRPMPSPGMGPSFSPMGVKGGLSLSKKKATKATKQAGHPSSLQLPDGAAPPLSSPTSRGVYGPALPPNHPRASAVRLHFASPSDGKEGGGGGKKGGGEGASGCLLPDDDCFALPSSVSESSPRADKKNGKNGKNGSNETNETNGTNGTNETNALKRKRRFAETETKCMDDEAPTKVSKKKRSVKTKKSKQKPEAGPSQAGGGCATKGDGPHAGGKAKQEKTPVKALSARLSRQNRVTTVQKFDLDAVPGSKRPLGVGSASEALALPVSAPAKSLDARRLLQSWGLARMVGIHAKNRNLRACGMNLTQGDSKRRKLALSRTAQGWRQLPGSAS